MATRIHIKVTAGFEKDLEGIERFLFEAEAPLAFDALLAELTGTVMQNLERFPRMGRPFSLHPTRSVEASSGVGVLQQIIKSIGKGAELREYVMARYLVLYAHVESDVFLLSIRHHRQLSFDFAALWPSS